MKIFISWSGNRSLLVAELLKDWLQHVIQSLDPWISSKDLDRGAIWFSEINDQLAKTDNGIVCLTKSNKEKPWILFESGALAKGLTHNRVFTFLIDLDSNDLSDPLAQFNHTLPNKSSLLQLVQTINKTCGEGKLSDSMLSSVFDKYYPDFDKQFIEILEKTSSEESGIKTEEPDYLNEILYSVRVIDKRLRKIEEAEDQKPFRNIPFGRSNYQFLTNYMESSIANLDLSVRAYNLLKSYDVHTVKDLINVDLNYFVDNPKLLEEITRAKEFAVILS